MEPSNAALVLVSGGLDSSVLLHDVVSTRKGTPVYSLSFDYGQRHAKELECAAWQAKQAGAHEHRVVDLSFLAELVRDGTSLVEGGTEVPDLTALPDADRAQPPTYVPNRNMTLLSIAAAYAETQKVFDIYYGAQAQDEYGYWDCTVEFLERMNAAFALNRARPVRVHAPFIDRKKAELVTLGNELHVDFSRTWSCYRGEALSCGTCPTCVERLNAFRDAGVDDPLPYANT
ncbi:MAG: 7-cyano-7-deazaguanine synthase QueC [Candidatus Hydrogenedentes bacterium]|nr:7-cyano-7-deazaguanine synthase QueC [Candidatus Hydrogenedentota bacterium]